MRDVQHGATDQSVVIRIIDSTDGTPEQAVEHNSAGIALWYRREGATKTAITPAALTALNDAHSDGGIEHIDDGYYRLDVPDAAFASGVTGVMIGGEVTGMVVIGVYVHLVAYNNQSTTRGAAGTALPDAAADAAGGLPISDAGALDLDARLDVAVSTRLAPAGTLATVTNLTTLPSAPAGWLTAAAIADGAFTAAKFATGAFDAVWSVASRTLTAFGFSVTVGTNNDKTGYALSAAGIQAIWDALTAALTTVGSIGKLIVDNLNATVGSRSSHSAADVWAAGTRTLTAATNISGPIADQVWEEAIADHSGTVGSTAEALNAAGGSGDPWSTQLPGAYGAGSAGKIVGDNLNATVSSRASQTSVDDIPTVAEFNARTQAPVHSGTCSAGGGSFSITLDAGASAITDFYKQCWIYLTGGTGVGQVRLCTAYNGTSKVATVDPEFLVVPDATTTFVILPTTTVYQVYSLRGFTAQPWANVNDATASASEFDTTLTEGDGHWDDMVLVFTDGALAGQARPIATYTQAGGTLTFDEPFTAAPANGAAFQILSQHVHPVSQIAAALNAEVVDALVTDTYAEPAAVPAATSSLKDKINWLFALARNKLSQTATDQTLRNDADNASLGTASVSDDGTTTTRGEWT